MAYGGGEESQKRILGCILLGAMPPAGLDEALESLRQIIEYWLEEAQYTPLSPPTPVQRSNGHIVSAGPRPDLVIAD